jgi:hypothetical protein
MPVNVGKIVDVDIRTSLDNKIARAFQQKILSQIEKILVSANSHLKKLIRSEFKDHPIIQSILGQIEGSDGLTLRGEFGLTAALAQDATKTLINYISDKTIVKQVKNSVLKNPTSSTVRNLLFYLRIETANTEEIMTEIGSDKPPFSYISKSRTKKRRSPGQKGASKIITRPRRKKLNAKIEWFSWLMFPRANLFAEQLSDFDIENYGIKKAKTPLSRSGEALMTQSQNQSVRFPYALPRFILPKGSSQNFIEEFFNKKTNQAAMMSLVKRVFKEKVKGIR